MPSPATWYFAYASNMNSAQMRTRAEVLEENRGRLENYELVFNRKARGGVATANIRQAPGKVVEGVLYRIPESAFRNLDRYEGAPQQYRRIEVTVTYGEGKKAGAQVYIATKVDKGLRPAPHYLQTILDGAAEHKFPTEYVEKIKEAAQSG
ncbi:MAG: gamma-glutamylcyclotransferase family protein [Candidatus Acidiferrales bacterium]